MTKRRRHECEGTFTLDSTLRTHTDLELSEAALVSCQMCPNRSLISVFSVAMPRVFKVHHR